MILLGKILHVFRNVDRQRVFTVVAVEFDGLHFEDVDQTGEVCFSADRNLERGCIDFEFLAHIFNDFEEVCAGTVHLVHKCHAGNMILLGLTPHGFGLGLNAADRAENADRAVENAQRTLHFSSEVHVSRGVDKVDSVFLAVTHPETGCRCGSNRDAAFLFLNHPVHRCGAVMNLTDFVGLAGVEKDTFRKSRLSRINVSHDSDITRFVNRGNALRRLVTEMF